jgi:hypothetical protein
MPVDTLVTVTLISTSTAPLGSVTVPEFDPAILALAESAVKRTAAVAINPKTGFLYKIMKETLLRLKNAELLRNPGWLDQKSHPNLAHNCIVLINRCNTPLQWFIIG